VAHAQAVRKDAIWARSLNGQTITLDGVMDEPAWAQAESLIIRFGVNNGNPGSGWKVEGGLPLHDSTYCVVKFLVDTANNQLYLGFTVRDSSVGGSNVFNKMDGFLMNIKDHSNAARPAPAGEYQYSWWDPGDTCCASNPGHMPQVVSGRWGNVTDSPRTPAQIAAFDGATKVHGIPNDDTVPDTGYTTELRIDLTAVGVNAADPNGDIVEWNCSVYDADWEWLNPPNPFRAGYNRAWVQDPWGNTSWYDEMRLMVNPAVTINSGPVPVIEPELRVPNGANFASPVIDGKLDDAVWQAAPYFDISYGNDALRASYPGAGPWRSGQYQPVVNGGQQFVADPGNARVFYFFKADSLFMGFNVDDQYVGDHPLEDRMDGFIVTLLDYSARAPDNNLTQRRLEFHVGTGGSTVEAGYLPLLTDTLLTSACKIALKPHTTVDTLGADIDSGYTAELRLDLTKLGYPHGLADGTLWFGVDYYDGDSFTDATQSYATRTWFFEEADNKCCPVWAYMDPGNLVVAVNGSVPSYGKFALLGSYPNPAVQQASVRYVQPEVSDVTLEVYDVKGRLVDRRFLGRQKAGEQQTAIRYQGRSGIHFYRLSFVNPENGHTAATLAGKVMLIQ
jgi:hypothetical protein